MRRTAVRHHRVASATGLLTFKGLNIADKVMLPRMAYLLARHGAHLDFHHPEKGLEFDNETVASFVKRELSQNVLNYVAGPLISTLFFFGSEETSKWLYMVLAKHMYNTRMSTLRGGIARVGAALSENIEILTDHPVQTLYTDGDSCVVDGRPFSDVVVAVPGAVVLGIEGLSGMLSEEGRQFFRDCEYQRVISVRVRTAARHGPDSAPAPRAVRPSTQGSVVGPSRQSTFQLMMALLYRTCSSNFIRGGRPGA